MGFGTLFVGYFLLLNLTYYGLTDAIAAAVMLYALYKLSGVNRYFKLSMAVSAVFLVFSAAELGIAAYGLLFAPISSVTLTSCMSIARSALVGVLSTVILCAIADVAAEVELPKLVKKCKRLVIATLIVYAAWIVLEAPLDFMNPYIPAIASFITIIATIIILVCNLTAIYGAYMRICMPGEREREQKPSKIAFVNEYRARKAEREAEAARQRAELMKQRKEQKGKKK